MEVVKEILLALEFKEIIALGSLSIAFLALFIAPFVNARNSKRQVIAPMRQAWINALRDKVSEFVSIASICRLHVCPSDSASESIKKESHKEDRDRYGRLKLLVTSVELHINPSEEDHQKLVKQMRGIVEDYHDNSRWWSSFRLCL
ncbi:hypothetical protein L1D40_19610 [Shewanella insulae]|uniref:hypothetical protein n=1 Tax=Shewanella insulae TaxID=2681496 RepID=UPI001EFCDC20|nr:hypothetical protein [Shewanella insulae]MCG9714849.1 hypothetical protein [Shewanella insulae]MCG9757392.1 hypothetical protein [Shewanella insulae]